MKLRTLQIVRAVAANAVVLNHFRLADSSAPTRT
jgi:hypothetical protein